MLRAQATTTVDGLDALLAWSRGDAGGERRLRDDEHRADEQKRELREALTTAFTTPLEPEDLFELSRGLDRVLNGAKNIVREAEVMGAAPDGAIAEMAGVLAEGMRELADALGLLGADEAAVSATTQAATRAAKAQSRLEKIYRSAMSALVAADDLREVAAKRELYRRFARASEDLREVAERVWYSVLKER